MAKRTLDEINIDYNTHAVHAGHKARVVCKLQDEVENHLRRMEEIDLEAGALKKEQEALSKEAVVIPPGETA